MRSSLLAAAVLALALLLRAAAHAEAPAPAEKPKTLADYYRARAYPGAPPPYTHKDEGDFDAEPDACLSCHKRGSSGAPVTPHAGVPECRHCHVRAKAPGTFRDTTFAPAPAPKLRARALPGAPPPMGHLPSALRGNCLACHGAKAGVAALKSSHPERTTCQQCHVPQRTTETWPPPGR